MQFQGVTFVGNEVWLVMEYMVGGLPRLPFLKCMHPCQ